MTGDRLKKIVLLVAEYEALLRDAGGLMALGPLIGSRAGVPDLRYVGMRLNGIEVQLFVHSSTFDVETCWCRAPVWAPGGIGV